MHCVVQSSSLAWYSVLDPLLAAASFLMMDVMRNQRKVLEEVEVSDEKRRERDYADVCCNVLMVMTHDCIRPFAKNIMFDAKP